MDESQNPNSSRQLTLKAIGLLVLSAIAAGIFLKSCFPIESSNDVWWHLKTGQVLLEYWDTNGFEFPEHDLFSQSGEKLPWANHEWLADVLMYLAWRAAGPMGLIVAKSLIIVLTYMLLFWLIYRRSMEKIVTEQPAPNEGDGRRTVWLVSCLGTVLAFMASQYTLYLRPPVLTYLFIVVALHLMMNLEQKRGGWGQASLWLLPCLMVVWVNLHGGAILGIVLAGLMTTGLFLQAVHRRVVKKEAFGGREFFVWLYLSVALLIASLINPFGYDILALTLKIMKDVSLIQTIGELQSPNFHFTQHYELLIIGFFALLAMRRRLSMVELLPVLFFLHQSLNHVRHLPVFALIVSPILFGHLAVWVHQRQEAIRKLSLATVALLTVLFTAQAVREGLTVEFVRFLKYDGVIEKAYPVEAVNFVEYKQLPGPMFNSINFAGYLIWRLSPEEYKVFTDSRFDIHGSLAMTEVLAVEEVDRRPTEQALWMRGLKEDLSDSDRSKPYWRYILDKHGFNFLIVPSDSRLALYLEDGSRGWKQAFLQAPTIMDGRSYSGYAVLVRDNSRM